MTNAPFLPIQLAAAALIGLTISASKLSADWPQFRGLQNASAPGNLPDQWTADDYQWSISTEAADVGSPAIYDGKVYFLSSNKSGDRVSLHCVGIQDGQSIWTHDCQHHPYRTHARNSQAASTPSIDANGVVYASADDQHTFLIATDHSGDEVWRRDFGPWSSSHGFATSPAIHGDQVVLLLSGQSEELEEGQLPGESYLVCVDRSTGETKWRCDLTVNRTCYGVPVLVQDSETSAWLVPHRGDGLVAIDSRHGEILWKRGELSKRVCSSVAISDGIVLMSEGGGSRGKIYAFKFDPKKIKAAAKPIYEISRAAPYVPSVAVAHGHVYRVDDQGIATVADLASGKTQFQKRIGGNHGSSPVVVGNRWLTLSLEGEASVLEAKSPFGVVAQFSVGDRVSATPAVSDGLLILRTGKQISALPLANH